VIRISINRYYLAIIPVCSDFCRTLLHKPGTRRAGVKKAIHHAMALPGFSP
jgi:hypothetical protein